MSEPLVLLPGMNCSAALWSLLDLSRNLDLSIDEAITPSLLEPTMKGQVGRLLNELPGRFALAGLSLGGIVAMALVRTAPERVTRLCLMSTTARPPTSRQYALWTRQRAALAGGMTARDLQRDLKTSLLSSALRADCPEVVGLTLRMAEEVGSAALDAQLALQATRVDERPDLRKVSCPTAVIAAQDDALCSVQRHEEIHDRVQGSELVVIERCGHLSPLERPAVVAATLVEWWQTTL